MGVRSQVYRVSLLESWSQAATLLVDINHLGSQEDVVSSWSLLTIWWEMLSLG